jgi:hypothetical protein
MDQGTETVAALQEQIVAFADVPLGNVSSPSRLHWPTWKRSGSKERKRAYHVSLELLIRGDRGRGCLLSALETE